jgi:hypothetical protein
MQFGFKSLLAPAAVVIGCGTASAAGGLVSVLPPNAENARVGGDLTMAHHTDWHTQRQWERRHERRYYQRYNYGPRCHWSEYYGRRVCR